MFASFLYTLKRPYHFLKTGILNGFLSELRYGFPAKSITVIAITGTDGKTTSSTMLYSVLKAAGVKVALLSTVAAYLGDEAIDTGFHVTSPQPADLQKFMHRMKKEKYTHLVLEATSHGIYQYRTWGIRPLLTGLTNIAREHLDYHLTYKKYVTAKTELLRQARQKIVVNADDASFSLVRKQIPRSKTIQYSAQQELPKAVRQAITARFPESYNQMNARLVYNLAQQLNVSDQDYIKGIQTFAGIPGRMQVVKTKKPFTIIVDFAHTPQALGKALQAIRQDMKKNKKTGSLIAIFGCAGLRDREKRPLMGAIATENADVAIFTAEDPRTEDIWSIIRQMKEQLTTNHDKVISIADRGEAIDFAINTYAKKGDVVAIFGKGHEQSMCYGSTEYPWNDTEAVEAIATGEKRRSDPTNEQHSSN